MTDKRIHSIFFILFALSGFSGLIYESIWTHYLKLFLGHAAYAQTLVLAIFMAGMAVGSWICSRYSASWSNLLLGYVVIEGLIGVCALLFHVSFQGLLSVSYERVIPALHSPLAIFLYKWTLSSFMILPQSILLGITFPLMSGGILRRAPEKPGRIISLLYFTNSIGGVVGVLVSGFVLVPLSGLPGAIALAGMINILVAASAWLLVRNQRTPGPVVKTAERTAAPGGGVFRLLLAASAITGTASFMYELGWIRMLSLVLGSSTHAFELMLSAFILGLAGGGFWIYRRIDAITDPVRFLVIVQILMGFFALASLLLYGNTFEFMQQVLPLLPRTGTGYAAFNLISHAVALAIMLPATFCAGLTLPLITFILLKRGSGERSIGAVYAANTLGAIIGIFISVHLAMPLLGLKGLITLGAGLDIGLGLLLLWTMASGNRRSVRIAVSLLSACMISSVAFFVHLDPYKMASGVYRSVSLLNPEGNTLLYHKDGKTATVSLVRQPFGALAIRTNGKTDGAIHTMGVMPSPDEVTTVLAAALPLLLKPDAKSAANIGFGTGLTTHTLLSSNLLERVDTIEIEPSVVEAANFFRPRVELAYTDPRGRIYIDDAKTFFSTSNKKYDIIISEPSNPWVSGVAGLFSQEFYRLITRSMTDSGLLVQWLHLYEMDTHLIVSVLKAMKQYFSDYAVFSMNNGDIMIVAIKMGTVSELQPLQGHSSFTTELRRIGINSLHDIEIRKVWSKKVLDAFLAAEEAPPNSDYYPVLDLYAVRSRFMNSNAADFISLLDEPVPILAMLKVSAMSWMDPAVVLSNHVGKSQLVNMAKADRDFFLHGKYPDKYGYIPGENKKRGELIKQYFSTCGSGMSEQDRTTVVSALGYSIFPYLAAADAKTISARLHMDSCLPSLSPIEQAWLTVFRAAGEQDAGAMAASAERLLEYRRILSEQGVRYAVAADMTGNLLQGRKDEARRIGDAYRIAAYGNEMPDMTFRVLRALATE